MWKTHGYPVIIVENWSDINYTMLQYWYDQYKDVITLNNNETLTRLTASYWQQYVFDKTKSLFHQRVNGMVTN